MFSPARVVTALSAAFGTDTACLNYREEVVFKKFHRILEDGIVGQIYFEDEDSDNEVMEEKKEKEWIPSDEPEETYSFGDKREISEKEVCMFFIFKFALNFTLSWFVHWTIIANQFLDPAACQV